MLQDEEFLALRLATWLTTPDGRLISDAVGLVIDPAYRQEYELIVSALKVAAKMQYDEGGGRRAGALAIAVGSAVGIYALVPSARRVVLPGQA